MIFWLLFFIVFIILFFALLAKVTTGKPEHENIPSRQPAAEQTLPPVQPPPQQDTRPEKAPAEKPVVKQPEQMALKPPANQPPSTKPVADKPKNSPQAAKPAVPVTPQAPPTPLQAPPPVKQPSEQKPQAAPVEKPVETRDRGIYFMRESGADLQPAKVNRKLPLSDSPLADCLNALFIGPTSDEAQRGLMSFIPTGARMISARVNGNTVVLNFNEEFRYNTLGREGSAAQLKQIVWTATEFPNIHNVQIQIEGKTVDFLTEGIAIRDPIGR